MKISIALSLSDLFCMCQKKRLVVATNLFLRKLVNVLFFQINYLD